MKIFKMLRGWLGRGDDLSVEERRLRDENRAFGNRFLKEIEQIPSPSGHQPGGYRLVYQPDSETPRVIGFDILYQTDADHVFRPGEELGDALQGRKVTIYNRGFLSTFLFRDVSDANVYVNGSVHYMAHFRSIEEVTLDAR